jgi:hypothetical protein
MEKCFTGSPDERDESSFQVDPVILSIHLRPSCRWWEGDLARTTSFTYLRRSPAPTRHGNHKAEIVGDAKGAALALKGMGNLVTQLASVASTAVNSRRFKLYEAGQTSAAKRHS